MSSHPLSGDYLQWLAPQIRGEDDGNPNRSYDGLISIMHETQFVELVPNDDNRVGDGLDLRLEFCDVMRISQRRTETFLAKDHPDPPCSFLETLIALSRRLEFVAGGTPQGWAWILVTNLDLNRITDPVGRKKKYAVKAALHKCIFRTYSPDGTGGFFPLLHPDEDQTKVEIWYQMAAYINEHLER
jgi:hypothetical protein